MANNKATTEMSGYAKYNLFVEDGLGVGPNGRRALHGVAVAGGVWAAGTYGGIEIIQENMIPAIGAGFVGGFIGTFAADAMLLDDGQKALMALERLRKAEANNPAMAKAIAEARDMRSAMGMDDGGAQQGPEVLRNRGGGRG
jgi:hypothetical protein